MEEAGIYGKIMGKRLGKWKYRKIEKGGVFNEGTMFAMYVTGELTHWPEIRKRIWVRTHVNLHVYMHVISPVKRHSHSSLNLCNFNLLI